MFRHTDTQEFHTGFHHPFGSVSVAGHDTVGQGTVIDSDADSRMILLTDIQKRHKAVMNLLYLLRILLVGIFQFLKSTRCIYIVARIDPYLFCILSCYIGHFRIKMHIGHQRNHISLTS